jgi:RimJ/RimL family protein N-acetyltransferase
MELTAVPLEGRFVRLEPLTEALREPLRHAISGDAQAWSIMGANGGGGAYGDFWDTAMADMARGDRIPFAVRRLSDAAVVGTSSLMHIRREAKGVEIGWTFYGPDARGGAVNPESKRLLLAHAFEGGAMRVEFMVDAVNQRSQAAVTKLGAVREGVMRKHRITWTGRVRDTVVFSIIDSEWPAVRQGLDARIAAF